MKIFLQSVIIAGLLLSAQFCESPPDRSIRNGFESAPSADSQAVSSDQIKDSFHVTMTGKIDGKYDVSMDLEREGDKLKGSYFYLRPGGMRVSSKYIMLEGIIDPRGNVTLTETDYKSDKPIRTGEFKGKLVSTRRNDISMLSFSGVWTRIRDNRSMPFSLTQDVPDLGADLTLVDETKSDKNASLHYELETSLPRLEGKDKARAAAFNQVVDKLVSSHTREFRELIAEEARSSTAGREQRPSDFTYSLEIGHSLISSSEKHISLLFSYFSFTGGAHPNTVTESLNYDLETGAAITLESLFRPGSNYLKLISDYCIAELGKQQVGDADWIRRGAGPDPENFKTWNITPQGLLITFDAYQVASYAEGPQEVVVPFSVLKSAVNQGGLLWSAAGAAVRKNED